MFDKPGWKKKKNKISFEGEFLGTDGGFWYSDIARFTVGGAYNGIDREIKKKFKYNKKIRVTIEDA